ncbi:hypothetical protein MRS44_014412 [Fusarium solani]|uniref:uncharacterized protein n=1 Tax=Fusarium solani TaxID=169388 RepID=UPI0032C40615|nr:hypothetical protein MRS44_014412 [Fusarium solani]
MDASATVETSLIRVVSRPTTRRTLYRNAALPTTTSSTTLTTRSSTTTTKAATPTVVAGNKNFTMYNCISEPSNGRILPRQMLNDGDAMTIDVCLEKCWMFKYAGVEYGRECWCGDTLNWEGNTGATPERMSLWTTAISSVPETASLSAERDRG